MVTKIKSQKFVCPFCGNELKSRFTKCFNVYCQGQKFNLGNLVVYRLNPDLGLGKIIKVIEIPISKSLDDEDTKFLIKFKVLFKNNIIKIIHPIDLIHFIFDVNEKIESKQGIGIINSKEFLVKDGLISYEFLKENGKKVQIYEDEIYSKFVTPVESLIIKQEIDPPQNFLLKYWAYLFHSYYTSYQIKCITNSRLNLMPHQINVTHRLSEEHFPRILLADEVGLGKTIEAGIYMKEMMARNLAEKILIIVPASLVQQWKFELENKFHIRFTIYDGKKVKELERNGYYKSGDLLRNPFYYDNLIICSLQFARSRKYIELLSRISWDIVIFDEAHHLRRYLINATTGRYRETLNYELARNLSTVSESMLLLTATPLQLHSFELFSLIELIHPEVFASFSEFEHFRKNLPFINLLIANINHIGKLNNFEVKNTIKLLRDLHYIDKTKNNKQILDELSDESFKSKLFRRIEEDHTLSKLIIRNRKKNVFTEEFINKRIVNTIIVNPTKEELDVYNEIRLYLAQIYNSSISKENVGLGFVITTLQKLLTSSKYAILKSLERRLEQITRYKGIFLNLDVIKEENPEFFELELEEEFLDSESFDNLKDKLTEKQIEESITIFNQEKILKEFYDKLNNIPYDSKSDKLIDILNNIYSHNVNEKVIVFTQFVDTLKFLKDLIKKQVNKYYVETFFGGLDKQQKDEAIERFRNQKGFAILLSTEIGGEGRNFQFCRTIINYDLPWNPMKLEQRIGRVDRIGQESREIFIYNFYMEGTVETDVVYALIKRIDLFEESIGILEPIIGKVEKDLKNVIFAEDDGKKRKNLNEFYRTLDDEIKKAKEIEMQLDDLMIDKKSFQMEGLIGSLASCVDVKLTHNELYFLINYFLSLFNNKYGFIKNIKSDLVQEKLQETILSKIKLTDSFLRKTRFNLSNEYTGTFDLEFAKEREEIDFFALGHPLINAVIDFCRNDSFKGNYTILEMKKENLPYHLIIDLAARKEFYLFIFVVKFQGYIIESQILSIILDKEGTELENFESTLSDIQSYDKLFQFNRGKEKLNLDIDLILNLQNSAKKIVKSKTSIWKGEIKRLNDKIYNSERVKKKKMHENNKKTLNLRISSLKQRLEQKEKNRPTQRQLQNINSLKDEERKKQRLQDMQDLEEEIRFIKKDITIITKKLDDLAFEHEDLTNEMKRRNLAKFYTNLLSFAFIRIID
ncbi:MAG: DEAD/DEAH box helicase family protein [Candidatus Lokiarchaeota archaeon]|nr:DEAD/DEAH box helicase family protein [Candidatus Lokiarchaeota archaeon]